MEGRTKSVLGVTRVKLELLGRVGTSNTQCVNGPTNIALQTGNCAGFCASLAFLAACNCEKNGGLPIALACIFSTMLIWMQYVKSACGKKLPSHRKKLFPTKRIYQLSISDAKMLLSSGKIGKTYQVRNLSFLSRSTKFPSFN